MKSTFVNSTLLTLLLLIPLPGLVQTLISPMPQANGPVHTLVLEGSTLYLGGNFTEVNGIQRNHAAALDLQTLQVLPWNPDIDSTVVDLEWENGVVYVAGLFQVVNGQPRNNLAAVDGQTGIVTGWDPDIVFPAIPTGQLGSISDIAVVADTVFIAGYFISVNGQSTPNLAALNASDASSLNWAPSPNIPLNLVKVKGNDVYCAGPFSSIGNTSNAGIAVVNRFTGAVGSWYPSPDNPGNEWGDILFDGPDTYLAGPFTNLGATAVNLCAKVDASAIADANWNPGFGFNPANYKPIRTLAKFQGGIVVGGAFDNFQNGHQFLVQLDPNNAVASGWYPQLNDDVRDIVVYGDTLIVAGDFTLENGNARQGLVAYSFPSTNLLESIGLELSVFPNPSSGFFQVESELPMTGFRVLDLSGRAVWQQPGNHSRANSQVIPSGQFSPGVYILEVGFENGVCRKKITVY